MGPRHRKLSAAFVLKAAGLGVAFATGAAGGAWGETPASALKLAKEYKIPPKLMARWEAEHKVPDAWIAGAKKEGTLIFTGSSKPAEFERSSRPFRERYPFIKVKYVRGSRNVRVVVPLVAFREGRYASDIVTGINTAIALYRKADALTDLTDLPNGANIPAKYGGGSKDWVGIRLRYYGLAYNTNLVKKSEMPKTWDDLRNSMVLKNRKLAVWYGIASWLLPLWGKNGPDWTARFVKDLYGTVKAEARKEGMTALTSLTAAGEFKATIAVAAYQVIRLGKKGAPIGFHVPGTVMVNASSVGILKGSPHTRAAKLYLNWLLSMEGQLFQYRYTGAPPIHKDLQYRDFVPFPDEVLGKTTAFRDPGLLAEDMPKLNKLWRPYWESSGGPKGKGRRRK